MSALREPLFIEFKDQVLHALDGESGIDLPLERDESRRITVSSFTSVANSLRGFVQGHNRFAYCCIPARGVSVRRLSLPANIKEDPGRLLALQLEAQLPVAPSELAWGFEAIRKNGNAPMQDFLVVAMRKEFLQQYSELLAGAGLEARFVVGAVIRPTLVQNPPASWAFLENEGRKGELTLLDDRVVTAIRVISTEAPFPVTGEKLFVSRVPAKASLVSVPTEFLEHVGRSAANGALQRIVASGASPLVLGSGIIPLAQPDTGRSWGWAVAACLLLLLSLSLRYTEAATRKSLVEKRLAAVSKYKKSLPEIDREASFLNFIKTNQPPYLETLAVVANSAPPGMRIDNLSLVRHGELSVRGSVQGNMEAPANFRAKLIDSGFFARVVIEEQTPVENNQKVNFRISAQVKPDGARKPLVLPAPKVETKTNQPPAASAPPQFTQK